LHHFQDKARYWSKIVIFSYHVAFDASVRGPCQNVAIPFGVEKLEWSGYPTVKKNLDDMFIRFKRIPAFGGRTERRTDRHMATA